MDDSSEGLYNAYNWTLAHKSKLIWRAILVILLAALVDFFFHNAVVYVDTQAAFPLQGITVYASSYGVPQKVGGGGLEIVPRTTKSLIVTNGAYVKTQTRIDLPWYGYVYKKVILQKDYNADKVPYMSMLGATCSTYMPSPDQLAYYNCDNPVSLVKYQNSDNGWLEQSISSLNYTVTPPKPYMGGVLGISHYITGEDQPDGDIVQVTPGGKTIRYSDPPDVNRNEINDALLFTDTSDPTDNRFVVVMRSGVIFIGTINQGTVTYNRVAPPLDYDSSYNQTLCTLTNQFMYCYQGPMAYGDIPEDHDYSKVTHSQILTYSLANSTSNTKKLNQSLMSLSDLYVTSSGDLFGKSSYYELYHFTKSGSGYSADSIAQNVTAATVGDQLYYVQDGGILAADSNDPTTTHQVFYSPNVTPKAVYAVAGKVFIVGTHKGDNSTTYAYRLNQIVDSTPGKRLIDLVPFTDSSLSDSVYSSDLIGDKLYIAIRMSVRDLNSTDFNVEFAQKKEEVLNYLATIGLHVDESQVIFTSA